jgi:radical SAM superfamily enzyme YgiQ (UPF0313 family)
VQTLFPPLGAMAIIQALIKGGYKDTSLFDIDGLRPPYNEVVAHFQRECPDVVGISGVVSTAYRFIKKLIATLHEILPETPVIVGGNVAANSDILLRLAKADYCVIGEGEQTIVEMMNYLGEKGGRSRRDNTKALRGIKGLTFIDENDVVTFTGYQPDLPADELYDLDYDILSRDTDINLYIIEPWLYTTFAFDPRSYEPARKGKKLATIVSTKGCVAKCTFCHRWDKGIRFVPVDAVIEQIKMAQKRYNVGFISFSDENFGSDHKWVDELLEKIAPLDVLWRVGGVRCRTVNLDMLKRMREAGCVNVQYGIESGSQRMLDVMEKNTKVQQNLNATKWTYEAGLHTVYSMLFGMPGECPQTIRETTEFMKEITEFLPEAPYMRMSINRLEALPGTPVYEYGKVLGLIGRTPEEEEKYLLHISDTDGGEYGKQLNFTDYPDFIVQSWPRSIWVEVMHNWYKKQPEGQMSLLSTLWTSILRLSGLKKPHKQIRIKDPSKGRDLIDTFVDKDFNTHREEIEWARIRLRYHPSLYWLLRHCVVLEVIVKNFFDKNIPKKLWLENLIELLIYYVKGPKKGRFSDYRSMRTIMKEIKPEPLTESERNLIPLQLGR